MLYLEDFLELIEPFPQEIRERLTEMRELDLQIQNETDKLDGKIDVFFQQCKKQKTDWKTENFETIRKDYLKLFDNADDKIQIASQLYDLIEKYLKKLDQELQKFKLELEADHAGITSKLEQVISSKDTSAENASTNNLTSANASLTSGFLKTDESDFTLSSSANLMMMMLNSSQHLSASHDQSSSNANLSQHKRKNSNFSRDANQEEDSCSSSSSRVDQALINNPIFHSSGCISNANKKNSSYLIQNNKRSNLILSSSQSAQISRLSSSSSINNINNNSDLVPNAASNSNRLSLNPKRSKPDKQRGIKKSRLANEFVGFEDNDNARNDFYQSDENETGDEDNNEGTSETATSDNDFENDELASDDTSNDFETNSKLKHLNKYHRQQYGNGSTSSSHNHRHFKDDWNSNEDTNERYCICKDVSYGDMIACDNSRCSVQWFHFLCVGLNSAPKGKWFCPLCVELKKKRKEKNLSSILSQQQQQFQNTIEINNSGENVQMGMVNSSSENVLDSTPSTNIKSDLNENNINQRYSNSSLPPVPTNDFNQTANLNN